MMKSRLQVFVAGLTITASAAAVAQASSAPTDTAFPAAAASANNVPCPPAAGYQAAQAFMINVLLKPGGHFSVKDLPAGVVEQAKKTELQRQAKDFPNLCRYAAANVDVLAHGTTPRTVFFGDSITELWQLAEPDLFSAAVLDRGVSGQTTPQILLRFYQDVVLLRPRTVHIIAGTNDVAEATGPESDQTIVDNIRAMIDMAHANHIAVVLGSIPPAKDLGVPNATPAVRILELNRKLRGLADERKVLYVDYYARLAAPDGSFKAALSNDGVHPNRDGYKVMQPLAEQAIASAQHQQR